MSERFERLFGFSDALYAECAPVIICAGALLKDNQSGGVLAQLKFKNLSRSVITSLKAELTAMDTAGRIIGESIEHIYLDLNVSIGEDFGSQNPKYFDNISTRSFSVKVTEVTFADGSIWSDNGNEWEPLKEQVLFGLGNDELAKQYRIKYGEQSKYSLLKQKDLWCCSCGTVNKENECYSCGLSLSILESFDMEELKAECDKRLAQEKAEAEKQSAEFEAKQKKTKKMVTIVAPIVCAVIAFLIVLNSVIIPNNKYNKAVSLFNEGKYEEAAVVFEALGDYKDSAEKLNDTNVAIYLENKKAELKNAKVGDYVKFGAYEQDNNTSNGKEEIEWLVLEVKDGKALVISKYALDCKKYNTSYTDVTWETCTLRKWLNNNFINNAFSTDEKAMIPTVTVSADKNPDYSTDPGKSTQDQIFLLSVTEANKYFSSDSARECKPTDYAVARGAWENYGSCEWWLRSPAYAQNAAANVTTGGSIDCNFVDNVGILYGMGVIKYINTAVRPTMWIDLTKIS